MDAITLTRQLVDIESISSNEAAVGNYLYGELCRIGYQTLRMPVEGDRFNVYARSPEQPNPAVVFSTHMDTVPPFIASSEDAGRIYGRGSCDAKGIIAAQIAAAQAQLEVAQINLGYTEIRAPIDGRISATAVTEGNVVTPTSGTLATLVSQDPMYVIFPIALRTGLELRDRYASKGGFSAVQIRLRLPTGKIYGPTGHLDYVSPTVAQNTDTITLRGTIPNPVLPGLKPGDPGSRELTDGEFVTVLLEGVQPVAVLTIPRAAILSDQQGDYVYVVDAQNKAQIRRIHLGQSTPSTAVVTSGLKEGELVISEGLQRARPGEGVSPGPATPPPPIPAAFEQAGTDDASGTGASGGGGSGDGGPGNGGPGNGGPGNGAGAGAAGSGAAKASQ